MTNQAVSMSGNDIWFVRTPVLWHRPESRTAIGHWDPGALDLFPLDMTLKVGDVVTLPTKLVAPTFSREPNNRVTTLRIDPKLVFRNVVVQVRQLVQAVLAERDKGIGSRIAP